MRWVLLLVLALVACTPTPRYYTIEDCLLKSGYSTEVTHASRHVAELRGVSGWSQYDQTVFLNSQHIGFAGVMTDTGLRRILFSVYQGAVYAFVFKHKNDPRAGEKPNWHGDCFLQLETMPPL